MTPEEIVFRLMPLDWYESVGKQHALRYGKNLSYIQYIYLRTHGFSRQEDVSQYLYTTGALTEQQRIYEKIQSSMTSQMLSSQNFITEGKNLEIEKLLRYVDIPPHKHDFVECAYVLSGKCIHRINETDYVQEEGSFVTIPYGFVHSLFPDEDCLCLTMKIRHETFREMKFPGLMDFVYPLAFPCGDDTFIQTIVAALWEQQESKLPYCDQIMEQLFQTMMFYMNQRFHDNVQYLVSGAVQDVRMIQILSYMLDNYQTVTLQSVAAHFHYSPSYLSRLFHEQAGNTFSAIMKDFKLRQAARLLLESKHKLNEICEEVGYKDTTQFIRNFKELYGVTPAQYRKAQRQIAEG